MRPQFLLPLASWLVPFTLLAVACGGGSNGAADGGAQDGGSGADAGQAALPFKPSNIDITGWDLSQVGDVDLSGSSCVLDGETPDGLVAVLCDNPFTNKVVHKIVTLPDQSRLSIFVMRSLRVEASTVLSISRGHLPVVLVALQTIELIGSIEVDPGTTGGAANGSLANAMGAGLGGGTAGDATGLAAGGGSFCGLGGKAGTNTAESATMPGSPTGAYGTPELVPLVPGSAGGNGVGANDVGSGGGALQIVAGVSFNVHGGGYVNVGGGGGVFGGQGKAGAGGGGSGGALLIESTSVTVAGMLAANGGGGGQGNGDSGENGRPDGVALGGQKMGSTYGPPGADGSFTTTTQGGDGATSASQYISAGGGGGGAGRIRINTSTGQATIGGQVSPAQGTSCLTLGKVG